MHESSCFVTLTYNDTSLPSDWSLNYEHFRLFLRRVRARFGPGVRFFMCGEYTTGDAFHGSGVSGGGRPHYHAVLFGVHFADRVHFKRSPAGKPVYRSALLESLWPHGFSSIGEVNFQSAGYIARYVMKRELGQGVGPKRLILDVTTGELLEREHEFCEMSTRPGLARAWLERFWPDVYPHGMVTIPGGNEVSPPRYYDLWYSKKDPVEFAKLVARRLDHADAHFDDNGPSRLRVKDEVLRARLSQLKRS